MEMLLLGGFGGGIFGFRVSMEMHLLTRDRYEIWMPCPVYGIYIPL